MTVDHERIAEIRAQDEAQMRAVREQVESDPLYLVLVDAAMARYGIGRGEAELRVRIFLTIDRLKQELGIPT